MQKTTASDPATGYASAAPALAVPVLFALSTAHLLNDMMQSLVPAIYPLIKTAHGLDFAQIGMITFTFQLTASLFQPFIGAVTDKRPQPYSMVAGMAFTLIGLIVLGYAASYPMLLLGAGLVGTGSSIFHPEATRIARIASGGQQGLAQSMFQLGGQSGNALGPLLAAFIIVPKGQESLAWFAVAALIAMLILGYVGRWYAGYIVTQAQRIRATKATTDSPYGSTAVAVAIAVLVALMFSKSAYTASFSSFYTFYLIERFGVSVATSQTLLFVYLAATAAGVLIGGPVGDRIGRRKVIWVSILGALPFSMMLPFANLFWTVALTVIIALIMSSAFAAILIFAMELMPKRIGMIGGLFYGLTFGLAGISAALLGALADWTSVTTVFQVCAVLPMIGLLAWFLPDVGREQAA